MSTGGAIETFPINGTHSLAQRLRVLDAKTNDGWIQASARCGPYGWYVSVQGRPCEIYLPTMEDAEACLRGVVEGLR